MVTGWAEINEAFVLHDENGAMVTGIQTIGGKRHLFHDSGARAGQPESLTQWRCLCQRRTESIT